jgi:protein involved in polysaccharide export with SLBB domain
MKNKFWKTMAVISPGLGLLVLAGWLAAGCQTEKAQFSPVPGEVFATETNSSPAVTNAGGSPAATSGLAGILQEADRFAIGDLVTVRFSGVVDQIQPHEERIKDDGNITLPLIGAVKAAGKTPGDLQTEIHDRYVPDYYKRLTITVTGEQRVYYVGGQVRMPGRQVYMGTTTVTKAIQSAGDFTDFAAKTRVELTRADGKKLTVNCEKAARDSSLDLPVYAGDKIHVPLRDWRDIFR